MKRETLSPLTTHLLSLQFTDIEGLMIFLGIQKLTAQFENITTLLRLALTLPVSSAQNDRAFSSPKRIQAKLIYVLE